MGSMEGVMGSMSIWMRKNKSIPLCPTNILTEMQHFSSHFEYGQYILVLLLVPMILLPIKLYYFKDHFMLANRNHRMLCLYVLILNLK